MTVDEFDSNESGELPAHVAEAVRAIEKLHTEHHDRATPLERGAAQVTNCIARPAFVGVLTVLIAIWAVMNLILRMKTGSALDAPPFPWLEDALTLTALYIALLILITQKRADTLAARREQLTLQVTILNEQKAAKIIALLEELRRDTPHVADRWDGEAEAMAAPVDHRAVTKALEKTVPDDSVGTPKKDVAKRMGESNN